MERDQRASLASPAEVAKYLQVPAKTLAMWRWRGTGPRFRKVGVHVRYVWADIEAWLDSQAQGGAA